MQLDFEGIKKLLPQRFPFIMIDRILEVEPGERVTAIKNISGNEAFFQGHFPEKAVMPGTLMIEAMAQATIVLYRAGKSDGDPDKELFYLGSVKARFFHPVTPGDQMIIKATNTRSLPNGAYASAEIYVEDIKVSEADLVVSFQNE